MEQTKLMQFYKHPTTAKVRRTVQISIQTAPTRLNTEADRIAKLRTYNHVLLAEMAKDQEYCNLVLDAGVELICSELVNSTDFEHHVELTPQEQIGVGIARMLFNDLSKK